ncbi:MAG: hypothetical protein WCK67_08615 [bacterium]
MIYTLPLADVLLKETILENHFHSNFEGWEIIDNEAEKSFVKDSYYWMENKTENRWMFYHKKMPVKMGENFIINAEIELINDQGYGQFGLVWGFDKIHEVVSRFTVSVDSNRFSICKFQKDHYKMFHRFTSGFSKDINSKNKQFFSIMLLDDYYYFFVNQNERPIYICHKSQMPMEGNRFGFYIEPGIIMRCDKISVKRIITNRNFDGKVWMPVDENLMPLGCELLHGN